MNKEGMGSPSDQILDRIRTDPKRAVFTVTTVIIVLTLLFPPYLRALGGVEGLATEAFPWVR